ncbi:hypothetical protein [Phenylobacterium sp.]|uniref:hypothetical protein n=1 Tax=Phenylobacterium sp. TaxID=1871053 RepID=UPI0025EDBCF5|nr:hypothetical protein [Phenylobacterium sp.]
MERPYRVVRSGPVEGVPRGVLAVPLAISFALLLPQLFGWTDGAVWQMLGWSVLLFPHVLAFPLSMLQVGPLGVALILGVTDLGLAALCWTTQPARLSWRRLLGLVGLWALLSALTAFGAPYLMTWGWAVSH